MKKPILILILVVLFAAAGCMNDATKTPQSPPAQEAGFDTGKQLDDYMSSIAERSDLIKSALEHEVLTQADMNAKSQELYKLWDDALNYIWGELKIHLSEDEFTKLQGEQCIWIGEKETALETAGKEFEGGSVYALIVNSEGAKMTEERVYALYSLLM